MGTVAPWSDKRTLDVVALKLHCYGRLLHKISHGEASCTSSLPCVDITRGYEYSYGTSGEQNHITKLPGMAEPRRPRWHSIDLQCSIAHA